MRCVRYEEMEGVIMEKPPRNALTDRLAGRQLLL